MRFSLLTVKMISSEEGFDWLSGKVLEKNGILDGKGSIQIVDISPRIVPVGRTPEFMSAVSARVSYGVVGMKSKEADEALYRYLVRNRHTSPLEMQTVTFRVKAPLFVVGQWQRHRTWSYNQKSYRYTPAEDNDFYNLLEDADGIRIQSKLHKQSSDRIENPTEISEVIEEMNELTKKMFELYSKVTDMGLARELARNYLPTGQYTTFYAQCNLNNLLKFLDLRCAEDAQLEIRKYADAIVELCTPIFPLTFAIWNENKNGVYLSAEEIRALTEGSETISSKTGRETFEKKKKILKL